MNKSNYIHAFLLENTQVEDPRKQWRKEQEKMLKEYLMISQNNLQVRTILLVFSSYSIILSDQFHI